MNGRRFGIIFFGLCGCAALGWVWQRNSSMSGLAALPVDVPGLEKRAGAAEQSQDFRLGEQRVYRLVGKTEIQRQGAASIPIELNGSWVVINVAEGPKSPRFAAHVADATIQVPQDQHHKAEDWASVKADLAKPSFFSLDEAGKVIEVRHSRDMQQFATQWVRSLVAITQFVRRDSTALVWEEEEKDATGTYKAHYQKRAPGDFLKRKDSYSKVSGGGFALLAAPPEVQVQKSETQYKFEYGVLRLLQGEELTAVKAAQLPDVAVKSKIELELLRVEQDPALAARLDAEASELPASALDAPANSTGYSPDVDRVRIAGQSLNELLAGFNKVGAGNSPERSKLFDALTALFRRSEESVTKAVEKVRAGDAQRNVLMDGLAWAGGAAAQKAVFELVKESNIPFASKNGMLIGVAFSKEPTEATLTELKELSRDRELGKQAKYSYGAAASAAADYSPARASAIVDDLASALTSAVTPSEEAELLLALGNTKQARALPTILKYLSSTFWQVRAAASDALRFMPEVDPKLAEIALTDPHPMVRATAIQSAGFRSPSAEMVQALDKLVRTDLELSVRKVAFLRIMDWAKSVPSLRDTLKWAGEHEPNAELRKMIQSDHS